MRLTERHWHSCRSDEGPESYQTLDVIQELPDESGGRQFIKFTLMETRWRSKREAADYLRWAAKEILSLPDVADSMLYRERIVTDG